MSCEDQTCGLCRYVAKELPANWLTPTLNPELELATYEPAYRAYRPATTADSLLECHCFASSEGECACGNFASDPRRTLTPEFSDAYVGRHRL